MLVEQPLLAITSRQGLLVALHMRSQGTLLSEALFTLGALVGSRPDVLLHVLREIVLSRETLITFRAWKGFHISVY